MKKCITLTLLLLACATPTKPVSISIIDSAYWIGTIAALHWVHKRIERMETLQEAQIRSSNNARPDSDKNQKIIIPQRPTFTGSLQELYRGGRSAVSTAAQTTQGLRELSNAQPSNSHTITNQ